MNQVQGHIKENISYISRYNTRIESILSLEPSFSHFELGNSKLGDPILYYKNKALDNEFDPAEAADKLFDGIKDKDDYDSIHVLIGLGTGYVFKKFAADLKGRVILLELQPEIMRMTMDLVDFSEELSRRNVFVVSDLNETIEAVSTCYKEGIDITFSALEIYQKLIPDTVKQIEQRVVELIPEKYEGGPLKLNIGPGKWGKKGWKKLDCYTTMTNFDIDLRKFKRFPLEDNVLEKAFSSHCIEHIEDTHLDILIKELFRCMAPGGILRLSCPDADQALEAYRTGNKNWFFWLPQDTLEKMLLNTFVSYKRGGPRTDDEIVKEKFATLEREEFIRWCISQADRTRPYIAHINGHYYDKIHGKLADEGFVDIKRSTYRGSEDEELRGEKFDLYPEFSLYVECKKPV